MMRGLSMLISSQQAMKQWRSPAGDEAVAQALGDDAAQAFSHASRNYRFLNSLPFFPGKANIAPGWF